MSSEDFFQEYVDEVQEHLQELESSLLAIERQGTDRESIGQIFRAVHSIKGASAYMGYEKLAHLTHELESRIHGIQTDARPVTPEEISVLLECVDFVGQALVGLQESGAEPSVPESLLQKMRSVLAPGAERLEAGSVREVPGGTAPGTLETRGPAKAPKSGEPSRELATSDPFFPTLSADGTEVGPEEIFEEDREIYEIFLGTFQERLRALTGLPALSPGETLSHENGEKAVDLLKEMISSSRYMDYEQVVEVLSQWETSLRGAMGKGRLDRRIFLEHLESYGGKLAAMLPGLQLPGVDDADTISREEVGGTREEEDKELFSIFLDSFGQALGRLAGIRPRQSETRLSPSQVEEAVEAVRRMIASARYMDYEEITGVLGEWAERLEESAKSGPLPFETYGRMLDDYGRRLKRRLPGLNADPPGVGASTDSLSDEIEREIESSLNDLDRAMSRDFVPGRENAVPPDARDRRGLAGDEEGGERDVSVRGPEKPVAQKERIPVFAEELTSSVTLRVDAHKVDQLLNQLGELVVTRSEFIQTSASFRDMLRELAAQGKLTKQELRKFRLLSFRLNESTLSLGRVANDLQASVMRIRMLPISQLFQRFPRVVRDQAMKHGKKVELFVEGGETEMDKRVLEQMNDPLVQFLRNAIAHGIEPPEERVRAGKPPTGTIRLAAYHAGDYVALEIEDDGRGIDVQKLRHILQDRRDIASQELNRLSDQELIYAIFLPGVSTRDQVDGSAGRGVGLDVVKENVERMNGSIHVDSFPGRGTRFTIWIPLTVAIIRALLVKAENQIFTLPLTSVSEIHRYRIEDTHTIEGFEVISLRGKTIPLVQLSRLLGMSGKDADRTRQFIVIVSTRFQEVGLVVDGLMGEREVVIKSIEDGVHTFEGFSGATILGDGTVSLILDVSTLLRNMKQGIGPNAGAEEVTVH